MNQYKALKDLRQKEFNEFPMMFAFTEKSFYEGMEKLGLKPDEKDQLLLLGNTGGYIRKSDKRAFLEMCARHDQALADAIAADPDGSGFIYEMFLYELRNHEYGYTYDTADTLASLGYTDKDIETDPRMKQALNAACKKIFEEDEW